MKTAIALGLGLGLASSVDAVPLTITQLETMHSELTGCILPAGMCFDYELGVMATNLNSVDLCATQVSTQWVAPIATATALGEASESQLSVVPSDVPQMFLARVAPGSRVTAGKMSTLNSNVKVESYFRCPNEYLVMYGTEDTVQAAMNGASLNFAPAKPLAVPDAWKISPDININFSPDRSLVNTTEVFDVQIRIATGSDASATAALIKTKLVSSRAGRDIEITETSTNLLTATGLDLTDALLQGGASVELAGVTFISRKNVFTTENFDAAIYAQSGASLGSGAAAINTAANSPFYTSGITGTGQVVGVGDSGLDYNHCMFRDAAVSVNPVQGQAFNPDGHRKIAQYWSYVDTKEGQVSGHGSHVCGTVAGDAGDSESRGVAYGSKISFFDIGSSSNPRELAIPDDLADIFNPAKNVGAFLHTNSWGAASNFYSESSRSVDAYLWANQDYLALFAAGNGGYSTRGTVGTPGNAKNILTVGAQVNSYRAWGAAGRSCPASGSAECTNHIASFSSIGPTFDSRIKPDIVAIGHQVRSAQSTNGNTETCSQTLKSGTSMATPAVAGAAALVRQYLTEGFYPTGSKEASNGFTPMGALIKAVLINSGDALTGKYGSNRNLGPSPSFLQGHGAINLSNTLKTDAAGVKTYLDGDFENMSQLDQDLTVEYKVTVDNSSDTLTVTLAYSDAPAAIQASTALINDLDMIVIQPSGAITYPNRKNSFDRLNNVEQIVLSDLAEGVYIIRINGFAVPVGPQPYALVVTGGASVVKGDPNGTLSPSAKPVTAAPMVAPEECFNVPANWNDSDGATYNCAWYASGTRCAQYGSGFPNNGVTANMACCACGGGSQPSGNRVNEVQAKTGDDLEKTADAPSTGFDILGVVGAGLAVGAVAAIAVVVGMKRSNSGRSAEVGFTVNGPAAPTKETSAESSNPSFNDMA